MTYLEVAKALEDFQKGTGGKWDWEAYLDYARFKDPYLVSIQEFMYQISTGKIGRNSLLPCQEDQQIKDYILELRRKALSHEQN